jgi:hypothetical protein
MNTHAVLARLWRAHLPLSFFASMALLAPVYAGAQQPTPQASQPSAPARESEDLAVVLGRLTGPDLPKLPAAAEFKTGDRTIAAAERVTGTIAASNGTVHVYGKVEGDVVSFNGDIVLHDKAEVTGNAVAIGGRVQLEGGHVAGQTLMLAGGLASAPVAADDRSVVAKLGLVGGWFAVLLVIAVGVMVLASDNLNAVADALERHYGSALVAGVAGQLGALPLLVALTLALILTILGILLVPFAGVAYVIVCAGLLMLGFLATAVVIGRGWRAAAPGSDRAKRAATLRAIVVGLLVLLSPWLVAAFLAPWPTAESLARGVAFAVSWVACTAGLGAALISRAGIRQASSPQAQRAMASPSWQTPTPVAGVVAARRPSTQNAQVK